MNPSFLVGAGLLLALAILLLLWPLLRRRSTALRSQKSLNIALYRERMAELEQERLAGLIDPEQYDQTRLELESALVADVDADTSDDAMDTRSSRGAAYGLIALAVLLPAVALLLHARLYTPLPETTQATAGATADSADMVDLVEQLAQRMQQDPSDGRGWLLLAQSYRVMGRYAEAIRAYEEALERVEPTADLLVQFSDAVVMQAGGAVNDRASNLVAQALAIDPDHLDALWLAGVGAFQTEAFDTAVSHWDRLHAQLAPGSEASVQVGEALDTARRLATGPGGLPAAPSEAAGGTVLTVQVELAPELAGSVDGTETVLVFAREVGGPPMPVAAQRLSTAGLPGTVVLDAGSAMLAGRTLDTVASVELIARVSRSGGVEARSGDLEGRSNPIVTGERRTIPLIIDRTVP